MFPTSILIVIVVASRTRRRRQSRPSCCDEARLSSQRLLPRQYEPHQSPRVEEELLKQQAHLLLLPRCSLVFRAAWPKRRPSCASAEAAASSAAAADAWFFYTRSCAFRNPA